MQKIINAFTNPFKKAVKPSKDNAQKPVSDKAIRLSDKGVSDK